MSDDPSQKADPKRGETFEIYLAWSDLTLAVGREQSAF
jgi:hypothetical protein